MTTHSDRGSMSVELVLLTPALMAMALFVLFLGRAAGAMEHVRHAADAAARSASVVADHRMAGVAEIVATADLSANGVDCSSTRTSVGIHGPSMAQSVTVTVSCELNLDGLSLLGASGRTLTASSTEVIDRYRGR